MSNNGFIFVWLLLFSGCGDEDIRRDTVPPRLIEVLPSEFVVPVDVKTTLRFSESLFGASVTPKNVMIVKKSSVSEELLADFMDGKLSVSHQKLGRGTDALLMPDGRSVAVSTHEPLAERETYVLLLSPEIRDRAGNPLVDGLGRKSIVQVTFKTLGLTSNAPEIEAKIAVLKDVPTNQKYFRWSSAQQMPVVEHDDVKIRPIDARLPDARINRIEQSADRRSLLIVLTEAEEGCARLAPNATYEIVLSSAIVGDFTTAGHCDEVALEMEQTPEVTSLESEAQIKATFNKKARAQVWFGVHEGALNCLGQPCPVDLISGVAHIKGLTAMQTYRYAIKAEDDVGNVFHAQGKWLSEKLPKIAINEVMPDPLLPKGSVGAEGEYIELVNFGAEVEDLANYTIEIVSKDAVTRSCVLAGREKLLSLAPGAFVLLTGQRFLESYYPGLDTKAVYRLAGEQLCGALSHKGQRLVLKDGKKRVVSSYGGYLGAKRGRSVERFLPTAPDDEQNFCYSRLDTGPTPTRTNGSVAHGCDFKGR